jgi:hypothetical protein
MNVPLLEAISMMARNLAIGHRVTLTPRNDTSILGNYLRVDVETYIGGIPFTVKSPEERLLFAESNVKAGIPEEGEGVTKATMIRNIMSLGWSESEAKKTLTKILSKLMREGFIYSPKHGFYKAT